MKEFFTKNKWVFFLLFIALLYLIADKLQIGANRSPLKEIPFSSKSFSGKWNLKQGTVSLEQKPTGSVDSQTEAQPEVSPFEIIRSFDTNLIVKLGVPQGRNKPNEAEMEIKGAGEVKVKLLADTGKYANFILYKPIDVLLKSTEILSYWEFTYSYGKESRNGILSCKYSPNSLVWTVITDQLNPLLTGAGCRMGVAGNKLYIAYPGGSVYSIDLQNGKLIEEVLVEKKLRNFKEDFAFNAEASNPPELIPYRSHMILHWKPATPKPTSLILLLWQDQIIDAIESSGSNLMIMKGETVTFTTEITSKEQDPANWIFTPNPNP